MIYKNNEIPSNYNKIAEIGDNYIIWVRESTLSSGTNYQAYIQFLQPSFSYIFTDEYRIKTGDNYVYNANYTNNGMYSYIDNYNAEYSLKTISTSSGDVITDDYFRSDYTNIFICGFIIVFLFAAITIRILPKTRR